MRPRAPGKRATPSDCMRAQTFSRIDCFSLSLSLDEDIIFRRRVFLISFHNEDVSPPAYHSLPEKIKLIPTGIFWRLNKIAPWVIVEEQPFSESEPTHGIKEAMNGDQGARTCRALCQ